MNEFNNHLETLSEHHDIPKVRWHGVVRLEAVPNETVYRLVLVKMPVCWSVGNGKGVDFVLWAGLGVSREVWYGVFPTDQYCNIFVRP